MTFSWQQTFHESLEIGATPLVAHFLGRLRLLQLFQQYLPVLPGRQPCLASPVVLQVLVTNLLLARQPLYALPGWAARRVPEHLGLRPDQLGLLNDDRIGRALDHLQRADLASLLTALVVHVVREFSISLEELHQDTTTVTFSGAYEAQASAERAERPPRITFGYNKDHRPDLKQLLLSITITDDGAVPVHCKLYDGNTSDDQVHQDSWSFLRGIIGNSSFLYVADSKLCTRENMHFIASRHGRFLTIMPRTRSENKWFREHLQMQEVAWQEVHRQPHPRRRDGSEIVYHGVEATRLSSEGYRNLWYRSSQKEEQDRQNRMDRLGRAHARLEGLQAPGRRAAWRTASEARQVARQIVAEEQVEAFVRIMLERVETEEFRQEGPGRPGPDTTYQRVIKTHYTVRLEEDGEALRREARCDGLFPLMTNDESLSLKEALGKYKYQPFVEKRHEQLKSVFGVTPMWLKKPGRVASMLWLYYVVELVQALLEREVRRQMRSAEVSNLRLYPENRASELPTTELVINVLEGLRRHRLLDEQGQELRRFYDALPEVGREVLTLLGMELGPWGHSS